VQLSASSTHCYPVFSAHAALQHGVGECSAETLPDFLLAPTPTYVAPGSAKIPEASIPVSIVLGIFQVS
jgi:hypothetical protein